MTHIPTYNPVEKSLKRTIVFLAAVCCILILSLHQSRTALFREHLSRSVRVAEEVSEKAAMPLAVAEFAMRRPDTALAMPVKGVRVKNVSDTWHAPRSGGRLHEGQDIFTQRGTPVYSAAEGIVLRVTNEHTNTLGGNAVIVLGKGGRKYYYAHLEKVSKEIYIGKHVSPSTLLGTVGTTGNARGTFPHLHFGIFTKEGAVDPLPFLRDRQGALTKI